MPTRTISIRVQHTEVAVSVSLPATLPHDGLPAVCPQCGGAWVTDVAHRIGTLDLNADALRRAAAEQRLHFCCTPNNELWICERSLQQIKETL